MLAVPWWAEMTRLPKLQIVVSALTTTARAVLVEPTPRPVKGNPAYVALLPVAVVFDVVVAVPLFLVSLAMGFS